MDIIAYQIFAIHIKKLLKKDYARIVNHIEESKVMEPNVLVKLVKEIKGF
jgi:hypothetical protein